MLIKQEGDHCLDMVERIQPSFNTYLQYLQYNTILTILTSKSMVFFKPLREQKVYFFFLLLFLTNVVAENILEINMKRLECLTPYIKIWIISSGYHIIILLAVNS